MRVGPSESACRSRLQPPSAALAKSHGRERGRKRLGITGSGDRQEEDRKETTAEVSKVIRRWPKPQLVVTAGSTPTIPAYGRSGIRHERWPELAMRRLNGTWETEIPMLTKKSQVEEPRGREYGCGVLGTEQPVVATKSSITLQACRPCFIEGTGSIEFLRKRMEPRGCATEPNSTVNPKGEE